MKWEPGRQGSGYFKKRLLESRWPLPFDLYLLKYPEGSRIGSHTDPVVGKQHYRINLILKHAVGGVFWKQDKRGILMPRPGRIHFFRPDIERHGVTLVLHGTRYVLSLGWVL